MITAPPQPRFGHRLHVTTILFSDRIDASDGPERPEPVIGLFLELLEEEGERYFAEANDALVGGVENHLVDGAQVSRLRLPCGG